MRAVGWILIGWLSSACAHSAAFGAEPGMAMEASESADGGAHHEAARSRAGRPAADLGRAQGFTAFGTAGGFVDTDDDGLPDARLGDEPTKPVERMLIYTGELRVEVAQAEEAARSFLAEVEAMGGYLQRQAGTSLTVRVPAAAFDAAFERARGAGRVLSESRQASDVTEEFADLGIRIENARRSRDRLLEILALAKEVEDILKVETELRRLTGEIERMEGRLKLLRDQVALATLGVEFQAVAAPPPVRRVRRPSRFGWVNRVGVDVVMEGF